MSKYPKSQPIAKIVIHIDVGDGKPPTVIELPNPINMGQEHLGPQRGGYSRAPHRFILEVDYLPELRLDDDESEGS